MIQPSKVIYVQSNVATIYETWLKYFQPSLDIPKPALKVAAIIMREWYELFNKIKDEALVDANLINRDLKKKIQEELDMKSNYVEVSLTRLRESGFLKENVINRKFMPAFDERGNISLLILFDVKH